jgi:hypothetical protein
METKWESIGEKIEIQLNSANLNSHGKRSWEFESGEFKLAGSIATI